jgi:KaiC/GvpD/RAD55 family RecA-like ATPase
MKAKWNDAELGAQVERWERMMDDRIASRVEGNRQVEDAIRMLERPPEAYLRWPWPSLDEMTGGMAPGDVWFAVAFSGVGKTTLVASAIWEWFRQGKRIMVLPLETRPKTFRVTLACLELGYKPGHVLSGNVHLDHDAAEKIDRIKAHLRWQVSDEEFAERVRIKSAPFIDVRELEATVVEARDFEADVTIVDHIDHIDDGDSRSLYEASVKVNKAALRLAHEYEPGVLLFTSQANQEAMKGGGDCLAQYQPPRPSHVLMGNTKRQIATGMVGIYRPTRARRPDESPEDYVAAIKACRAGTDEAWKALEPGIMGVNNMKSRNGMVEGARCQLRVEHGRVVEIPEKDRHATARGASGRFV